jgi:hypothetical protein
VRSFTSAKPDLRDGDLKVEWRRGSHATTAEVEEGARKALANPKQRKALIEKLAPEDRAEIAKDVIAEVPDEKADEVALAAYNRDEQRRTDERKRRKTVEREVADAVGDEDPNEIHRRRYKRRFAEVKSSLYDLFTAARQAEWTEDEQDELIAELDEAIEYRVDRVRLALSNTADIDWDEAASELLG